MTAIILFFAKELLLMQTGRMLTLVVPWSRFWWHRHSCPACAGCWWWSQTPWCPWCCHRWSQTSQKSSVHPAEHNHGAVTVLGIFSANISTLILALCRANSWIIVGIKYVGIKYFGIKYFKYHTFDWLPTMTPIKYFKYHTYILHSTVMVLSLKRDLSEVILTSC